MPVRLFSRCTHVIIVFAFLIRLRTGRLGVLRMGESLQRCNVLVKCDDILLDDVCQLGYFDRSVVEERFPLRHCVAIRGPS